MLRNIRRANEYRVGRAVAREWTRLQALVNQLAAKTTVEDAKFRWRSSGHHLTLGCVAASFTSVQEIGVADLGGRSPGIRIVFGSLPGAARCQSSMVPEVWDVVALSHDNHTVVWSVGDKGLYRSEDLAAEIVGEIVRCHQVLQQR